MHLREGKLEWIQKKRRDKTPSPEKCIIQQSYLANGYIIFLNPLRNSFLYDREDYILLEKYDRLT